MSNLPLTYRLKLSTVGRATLALATIGTMLASPGIGQAASPAAPNRQGTVGPNITKIANVSTAAVGGQIDFTITISNPLLFAIEYNGPTDTLSPTLSLLSATPGYSVVGSTVTWNPVTPAPLASNATSVYTLSVQAKECGDVLNIASFRWRRLGGTPNDPYTPVSSAPVGVKVPCPPSGLVYTKEADQATVVLGGTLQWTIRVTNTGGTPATYYGPYDTLPGNVTFQSATPGYAGPNPVFWNPSGISIAPSATHVYTISVRADGPCNEPIKNTAMVEGQGGGFTNQTETNMICDGQPKLSIEKQVSASSAMISNTLVYTILVKNSGTGPGSYTGPIDPLPLGNVSFQSATPGYTGPNPLQWNTGSPLPIAPGATHVYTAAVHVDGPCGATFYNRALLKTDPAPLVSNVVSTTVSCPTGWKIANPPWVQGGGVFTYVIALQNPSDAPVKMGWSDAQLRVKPGTQASASPYQNGVIATGDLDGDAPPSFDLAKAPGAQIVSIDATGPCRPPYLCDFLTSAQLTPNFDGRVGGDGSVSWEGNVPAKSVVLWPIAVPIINKYPKCGKEIKNTVVITNADGTISYGVAYARVMCPDFGDAPDSSNHFGNPMRIAPFGQPSPGARYPSVFNAAAAGDEGPIHHLAGSNSNLFTGAPANAIDSALGYRPVTQTANSLVSNERDADWSPDQEPAWLEPNIRPSPVITNGRSNRDGYDNAFTNPISGAPLPVYMAPCANAIVRYAQYVNPATPYPGTRYVNMWVDWNMDGDWQDSFTTQCGGTQSPIVNHEWVAQNIVANPATGVYTLPPFVVGSLPIPSRLWVRISIADAPAPAASVGNGPAAGYVYGETEDHFLCRKPQGPVGGETLWYDCPSPQIALPDKPVLTSGRDHVFNAKLGDVDSNEPVTITWRVTSSDTVKFSWDLKANVKVLASSAARINSVEGGDGTGPVTETTTRAESDGVIVRFFAAGVYTLTAEATNADGEVSTESTEITVEPIKVYMPVTARQ